MHTYTFPCSLDASETGESTKRLWVETVGLIAWGEGTEK